MLSTQDQVLLTAYEQFYWKSYPTRYPLPNELLDFYFEHFNTELQNEPQNELQNQTPPNQNQTPPTTLDVLLLYNNEAFKSACRARGLSFPTLQDLEIQLQNQQPENLKLQFDETPEQQTIKKLKAGLEPLQLAALTAFLNLHDKRSLTAKLKELGLTTKNWQVWLKQPNFQEFLSLELSRRFDLIDFDARVSLATLVQNGDLNGIKFYYELTGKYRPNSETAYNLGAVLSSLMEILARYLTAEILQRVADEFEQVLFLQNSPNSVTVRELKA